MAEKPDGGGSIPDDKTLVMLARQMRGMTYAKLRFIGEDPAYEHALADVLLALGISSESEHIPDFAPSPQRRYSFRFEGTTAILTVALGVEADHY